MIDAENEQRVKLDEILKSLFAVSKKVLITSKWVTSCPTKGTDPSKRGRKKSDKMVGHFISLKGSEKRSEAVRQWDIGCGLVR